MTYMLKTGYFDIYGLARFFPHSHWRAGECQSCTLHGRPTRNLEPVIFRFKNDSFPSLPTLNSVSPFIDEKICHNANTRACHGIHTTVLLVTEALY